MSVLLVYAGDEGERLRALLAAAAPGLEVVAWPTSVPAARVAMIACWQPPPGFFLQFTRLRVVFALGAGVDRLVARDDLPARIPIVRLLDAGMAEQMVEYALYGVLTWQRRMLDYRDRQSRRQWHRQPPIARAQTRVGVLGLGVMGGAVATALAEMSYPTFGWSRRARDLEGVHCVHGADALGPLLENTDVLINALPSTPDTRKLLDRARLARLPPGAFVVNASRGDQLDADALLALLDAGRLSGALLDVFDGEPLATDSPLWRHPRVIVTPHVAATTLAEPSVRQIVANLQRLAAGEPLSGVVDRGRGY